MGKGNRLRKLHKQEQITMKQVMEDTELQKLVDMMYRKKVQEDAPKLYRRLICASCWTLHREFGFGRARIKKYYDRLLDGFQEVMETYKAEDAVRDKDKQQTAMDAQWWIDEELKKIGVDLKEWIKE